MTKKEELESYISKIEKGLKSDLEEKYKISLREALAKLKKQLADLKEEKPAEKKASAPAPAKKVSTPAKKEDSKKSAKSVLDNCKEILRKHNKEKASAKSRIEKRKKQGKPAQLTPSETVKKTAQVVKAKVVDMKDKGLSASEIGKLADGIIATIKSTFAGIKSTSEKHLFLANLKKEISYLDSHLSKVAEYGGMFADGGALDGLMGDMDAPVQNVGGTLFSTADLTSHLDMNANPMFKHGGQIPSSLQTRLDNVKKQYGITISKEQSLKAYEMHNDKGLGGSTVGYELFNATNKRDSQTFGDLAIDLGRYYSKMSDGGYMAQGGLADYYEKKKYKYEEGGLTDENTEMLMSQIKEIKHHAEEIENLINNNTSVEAWVVAKAERSATDLSDITHYIDGKKETFAEGGEIKWQDVNIGDSANVKAENKTGVIVHSYGRKFNVKFVDGSEKTYDASELEFFKDDEDMFKDGGKTKENGYLHIYKLKYPNYNKIYVLDDVYMSPNEAMKKMGINLYPNYGTWATSYKYSGVSSDSEKYKKWHELKKKGDTNEEAYDKVFETYADGGEIDPNGMIYALQNHVSSGFIANHTKYQDYNDIDNVRGTALEILYKEGDMPYSVENLVNIIKQAEALREQRGYAQGGRFNTGRAWTLDHYQHNKDENYEVPTNDRKYAYGGGVREGLHLGDILEFDGKKYQAVLGANGMVSFMDIVTKDIVKTTNMLWDVIYNEGIIVKKFSNTFAEGGKIKDQYKGRTPEDIWNNLDKSQRQHFIYDHVHEIENYRGEEHGELSSKEIIKAYNSEYTDLDKNIKNRFNNHVREGQYADGGKTSEFPIVSIYMDYGDKGTSKLYNYLKKEQGIDVNNNKDYRKDKGTAQEFMSGGYFIIRFNKKDLRDVKSFENKFDNYFFPKLEMQYHYHKENPNFEHGGDTDDSKKKELKEILSKDYETFVELLGENIKDPKFRHTVLQLAKENKIKTKVINVECEKLRPTQNEISLEKSLLFPLKSPSDADKYLKADHPIKIKNATILTCDNGEYIIDGHHRWSQVFVLNPKAIMSCTDFYQLKKPFVGLKATQLGISADLGYLPTSNVKDINMLKVSEADLKKYVTDNITEEVREVFKKNGINNPEEHIWKNVVLLKTKNKPVKGASKRDYMPQTDRAENFEKYTPNVSKLKKGGSIENFNPKSLIGKHFYSNTNSGKITDVNVISNNNIKVKFETSSGTLSIEQSFTKKQLFDMNNGKTVAGKGITKMMKGGNTTFADKVKAIAKKHLKNKKVSPSVQKDYGKTYNKQEALDSAKRIVGAMRKKEMLKKKVKIKTDGFQNLDLVDFDKDANMVVDNA